MNLAPHRFSPESSGSRVFLLSLVLLVSFFAAFPPLKAGTADAGHDFIDHGVASPLSNARGIVATADADGRNVVLVWLMDHRGGYALLSINAATGQTEQFPVPFDTLGDSPYASLLSTGNKYYTHFGSHFVEFDPATRKFTFVRKTTPQMAMSMTEDDQDVIWSVTYPQSGVVSFDPQTKVFHDYGHVYSQNWAQYPRFVATDDAGWLYFGLGNTASQIVAFDPTTGQTRPLMAEADRKRGMAYVYRDLDGKVYGQALHQPDESWLELYRGVARKISRHDIILPKPVVTGPQTLFHPDFPNGAKLRECDPVEQRLVVDEPPDGTPRTVRFDYTSDGAIIMGVATAPDGTLCGGTTFPMRFFSYNPVSSRWINRRAYDQWNTVASLGEKFYVGGYGGGFLLEWNPGQPWVETVKARTGCNPRYLTDCSPVIHRPTRILPALDGKTIVMAGTPDYGYTGGGLLFWDTAAQARVLRRDSELIPDQSTLGLVSLPGGKLLGGTTTTPGTGGEKKAKQAEIYLLDFGTKKVEWRQVALPGVQEYTDLCLAPDGLVYGLADRKVFFVFDANKRAVVHQEEIEFGPTFYQQGPRCFIKAPDGTVYLLLRKAIVRIEPGTFALTLIARPPRDIDSGGDYLNGRIYFVSGSHLCSYRADR